MSQLPGVTFDEYGRAYCAAHNLECCHICCMSFAEQNEDIDENPSDRDVGVFLSEASLVDWHTRMKEKMPQIYSKEEEIFGGDKGQHPYGTKLLAHIINEPVTVVGSRWKKDELAEYGPGGRVVIESKWSCVDGREPQYVVWTNGELTQVGLQEAHPRKRGKRADWWVAGHDPRVNDRLDALARAHMQQPHRVQARFDSPSKRFQREYDAEDEEMCDFDVQQGLVQQRLMRQKLETLKRIPGIDGPVESWNASIHGSFLSKFFDRSFSPQERSRILRCREDERSAASGSDESNAIAEKIRTFPVTEGDKSPNFYSRILVAKLVECFVHDSFGSAIVCNQRRTKFQAIDLNNCLTSENGIPVVEISYATDPEGPERPIAYLRGEKIKYLDVSNSLSVALEDHLLNCVSNDGFNDLSGLLFHEGYLVPMDIIPWAEPTILESDADAMPDINFGVELEGSCASGNYREKMASSLAKHAQIDVHVRAVTRSRKGAGFGKGGKNSGKGCNEDGQNNKKWKVVYDESIEPNPQNPHSLVFEFVSPILSGARGLGMLSNTVDALKDVACVRVNSSMGLHVHIEVKGYSLDSMKSLCQKFLLYEDAIDSFLPYHRRTGSEKCHSYFESNLLSMMSCHESLKKSAEAIFACETHGRLYDLMNPGIRERYHKMNLQNLSTGRQPTIEFRQHHATKNTNAILCWVRFCALFVTNAANLPPSMTITQPKDASASFDELFQNIIKCPPLSQYYSKKRGDFARTKKG